jgi:RNA polymerase-interacting CarD/CdnL/TRCF family regulator
MARGFVVSITRGFTDMAIRQPKARKKQKGARSLVVQTLMRLRGIVAAITKNGSELATQLSGRKNVLSKDATANILGAASVFFITAAIKAT